MEQSIPENENKWETNEVSGSILFKESLLFRSSHLYFIQNSETATSILGTIVIATGLLGLTGWIFDVELMKSIATGFASMKANTAICFVMAGISMNTITSRSPGRWWEILSAGVIIVSSITLVEYFTELNLGIDQIIFKDIDTPSASFPGRMSPSTAICFLMVGISLLLSGYGKYLYAQIFALITGFIALLAVTGYIYNVNSLYKVFIYSSMAIHTAGAFLLLSWGLIFIHPGKGMLKVISGYSAGGLMSRRLLPAAIIIPPAFGIFIAAGQNYGLYDMNFAISLLVLCTIITTCAVIFWNAHSLYRLDLERQHLTVDLEEAEKKYRTIFENSIEGICQILPSGKIITANPSMAATLHYDSVEELLSSINDIKKDLFSSEKEYRGLIRRLEERGEVAGFETELLCGHGGRTWVSINIKAIKDNNGTTIRYDGALMNISGRKQHEEERKKLEEQLRHSKRIESIGRLAGGIAHDFNNLLVPILGYTELGMMNLTPEDELYESFDQIRQAGESAAALAKQILAFSRRQVLEMKPVDVNEIINGFRYMLSRLIREDIEFRTTLASGLDRITADRGQIEQILMNLIVNACDAMPSGGLLSIETDNVFLDERYSTKYIEITPGPHVMLAVSDNGKGMDEEILKHIFDPFFTTKSRDEGTGLGLSTVFGIVKQHKGNIWVYSEPGKGTTFKIYFPQLNEKEDSDSSAGTDSTGLAISAAGNETILVAEDEEMVKKLVCETLHSYGYNVIESGNSDNCLEIAANYREDIHLVLTDLIMPSMNGRELYSKLREFHPESSVLYMSGYTDHMVINNRMVDEGSAFLQKPFSVHNLMHKVRAALD